MPKQLGSLHLDHLKTRTRCVIHAYYLIAILKHHITLVLFELQVRSNLWSCFYSHHSIYSLIFKNLACPAFQQSKLTCLCGHCNAFQHFLSLSGLAQCGYLDAWRDIKCQLGLLKWHQMSEIAWNCWNGIKCLKLLKWHRHLTSNVKWRDIKCHQMFSFNRSIYIYLSRTSSKVLSTVTPICNLEF